MTKHGLPNAVWTHSKLPTRTKVSYSRHLDLLSAIGLLAAFQAARRLVKGGCVWLGLPCSSFVWMSRGSTFRCRIRPRGNKKVSSVRRANRLVRRVCYLLLVNHDHQKSTSLQLCSNSYYLWTGSEAGVLAEETRLFCDRAALFFSASSIRSIGGICLC